MFGSQRVLTRVRSLVRDFNTTEQALAGVLLSEPQIVLNAPVTTWAQRAGVSTASVIRFCRKLGFTGLRDFRVALAVEMHDEAVQQRTDDVQGLAQQIIASNMQALRETSELLDLDSLERAARLILSARSTEFFALGLSSPIALDASFRLQRMGLPAAYSADAHMQAVRAANLPVEGGVAFAISHSGRSPEVVAVATGLRQRGIPVVALTSAPLSPLAAQADLALIAATSEARLAAEARSSRIAHLAIIDTLCALMVHLSPDRVGESLNRTRAAERSLLQRSSSGSAASAVTSSSSA